MKLRREHVAEIEYQPGKCDRPYALFPSEFAETRDI
jgi:hypothetical protein